MISVEIPGVETLQLQHLVLDYNGTIAVDGKIIPGVRQRLQQLAFSLEIHVFTADTFGSVKQELDGIPASLTILPADNQDERKLELTRKLGLTSCVCIGNGRNDALMVQKAALGIALIQQEGASWETVAAARVICLHINDALDLLLHPLRLKATLRK